VTYDFSEGMLIVKGLLGLSGTTPIYLQATCSARDARSRRRSGITKLT
jgi:hypothetical protein